MATGMHDINEMPTDAEIIAAIKATKGTVCYAADALKISRKTIYYRAKDNPEITEAIQEAREEMVDKAEVQLHRAVQRGDKWAVMFALRTQGRNRGYVERQEIEHDGSLQVKARAFDGMSETELMEIVNEPDDGE